MKAFSGIKGSLLLALFILSAIYCKAQVTGNAFLAGQTDHSGIRVKFIPNSPTAQLDSAFTATNGSYTANLAGGLYQVLISKAGYQSSYLNSGNAFAIPTSAYLDSITLQPGNTVIVSGNASGNWTANNIYIVNGNITIPANTSLTIAPGTQIKFNGYYGIVANGTLNAVGSSNAPIIFSSNLANPAAGNWNEIEINNSGSTVTHCVIEYCKTGIATDGYNTVITNNEIRYCSMSGIYAEGGSSTISGNSIHDYENWGIYGSGNSSTTTITCNTIYNGGATGIITGANNIVRNNTIYNLTNFSARGIAIYSAGTPTIENNFINNCKIGISIGQNVTPIPIPLIINNTIVNNTKAGIDLNEYYANARIINNVIANNGAGIKQNPAGCSICTTTPDEVSHNLVWNNTNGNFAGVQKTGIGQIVTTNSNGDPIDSYFNFSKDPLFVNNTPPALNANSPVMNVGNTTYSANIGFAPVSNCSSFSVQSAGKPESLASISFTNFPNPFSEELNITYSLQSNTTVTIELFDLTGKRISVLLNEKQVSGEHQLKYNGSSLKPGMYLLKIQTNYFKSQHSRIVKQ